MTDNRYRVNGQAVAAKDYVVHGEDDGLLRGLTIFETVRTHNGRFFRLDAHLRRLVASARHTGLEEVNREQLDDELHAAIEGYPLDAKVNVLLTAGGQRLVRVSPLEVERIGRPLRVQALPWEPPPWIGGRTKHCSRAMAQVATQQYGVDEIFWLGRDGTFTEANRSNIFAVVDGILMTPPDDGRILQGVTRSALLTLARDNGIPVKEGPLRPSDPMTELYASSTLKHLSPVVTLNGETGPGGGPLGARLNTLFADCVQRECGNGSPPSTPSDL